MLASFYNAKLKKFFMYTIMMLLLTSLAVTSFPVNATSQDNNQKISSPDIPKDANAKLAMAKATPRFNSEATNGILTIELTTDGAYSVRTGDLHPLPNERILYPVGTGFDTVRSMTTQTDYIMSYQSPGSSFPVTPLGSVANIVPIGTTGFKITYVVTNPDTLTIERTILIHGTTVADSWVEVTTKITNTGNSNELIKARYFWDLTIGGNVITFDDGPTFRQRSPDASTDFTSHNFINPGFEFYDFQSNISTNNLKASGTTIGPSIYNPTTPQRLSYNPWPSAYHTAYDYSTPDGTNINSDSAVLYYFGDQTPFNILPNHSKTISASIFDTLAVAPGEIDGTKWNDTNANSLFDNNEVGVAGVQICATRTNVNNNPVDDPVCATTDANGNYTIPDLLPGFYMVSETQPVGTIQTFPANGQPNFVILSSSQILQGVNFGNVPGTPGEIDGVKFDDVNSNGIFDDNETGVSGITICRDNNLNCVTTDANGNYSFANLPPGTYNIYENLGPNVINTTPKNQQVVLGIGQNVTNINFGDSSPTPPPPEVTIENQVYTSNGLPVVYWGTGQTFTKDVGPSGHDHCGSNKPVAVELYLTFSQTGDVRHKAMTNPNPNNEIWTVTFDPFVNPGDGSTQTDHGDVSLRFLVDCPPTTPGFPSSTDGDDEIQQGGSIYVDPSGHILDSNNNPISGATVTLLKESPPGTGNYILPNSTDILPTTNPQVTGPDGSFGWDVVAGKWLVNATKIGFTSNSSQPLVIPPAATNLNITLSAQSYCGKTIDQFSSVNQGTMGDDVISGTSSNDLIIGNGGDDSLFGNAGDDCIIASDGNNYISGGLGNDNITVNGTGNNKIWGGADNDTINGGSGNDRIVGGTGNDMLNGNDGNDFIWGQAGDDTIDGGAGTDTCIDYLGTNTATSCDTYYHP